MRPKERSTDRDKPTLLTSNGINDDLNASDTYKFTAGPGKLTVTIEVKASGTNAGAMLDLFDAKSRPILSDVLAQGVDGGNERIVNSVQLSGKRDIVMRIKGLKYGDTGGTAPTKLRSMGRLALVKPLRRKVGPLRLMMVLLLLVQLLQPVGAGQRHPPGSNLVSGQLDGSVLIPN